MSIHSSKPVKSLTAHYCLYQAAYFVASAGVGAFAVTYLMAKGFIPSQTGMILAVTNILSCALQPILGSQVDRRTPALLPRLILAFLSLAFASFAAIELLHPVPAVIGVLFVLGSLAFSLPISLSNALCAHYTQRSYRIDYGMGSGVGSLSFSFASLGIGYIIAQFGTGAMMLLVLLFILLQMLLVARYPRIREGGHAPGVRMRPGAGLSIPAFCRRYRFFMLTMIGAMMLAACHTMIENYLIHIFERLGGGSEHVGTALFLACTTAAPFLLVFEKVQSRVGIERLMRLSGVFFVLKAVLMVCASSVLSVYLVELLQLCTYGFLYPSLYYTARSRIAPADMAKGQALATALYTLGAALGNSLGGVVIDLFGLTAMLVLSACIAAAGTALIHAFVSRPDAAA